jgi:hypothetical protein
MMKTRSDKKSPNQNLNVAQLQQQCFIAEAFVELSLSIIKYMLDNDIKILLEVNYNHIRDALTRLVNANIVFISSLEEQNIVWDNNFVQENILEPKNLITMSEPVVVLKLESKPSDKLLHKLSYWRYDQDEMSLSYSIIPMRRPLK